MDRYILPEERAPEPHTPAVRQVYIFDVKIVDRSTLFKKKTPRPFKAHYHPRGVECDELCEVVE